MNYHELKDIPQTERDLEYLFEKKKYFKNELDKMQNTGLLLSSRPIIVTFSSSKSVFSVHSAEAQSKI